MAEKQYCSTCGGTLQVNPDGVLYCPVCVHRLGYKPEGTKKKKGKK